MTSASARCNHELASLKFTKPGPATSTARHVVDRCGLERGGKLVGNLTRRATCGLRNHEGDVGRPVTVLETRRTDELDLWGSMGMPRVAKSRDNRVGQDVVRSSLESEDGRSPASMQHALKRALVAQGIEHRPPEPGAQVRILPRAPSQSANSVLRDPVSVLHEETAVAT